MAIQSLFKQLNRTATIEAADMLLQDYHHRWARYQGYKMAGLQSPEISGMPRSDSVGNHVEDKIITGLADDEYITRCQKTVALMQDATEAAIIKYTYMVTMPSVEATAEQVGLTYSGYNKAKPKALLSFAEFWPDELLIYD